MNPPARFLHAIHRSSCCAYSVDPVRRPSKVEMRLLGSHGVAGTKPVCHNVDRMKDSLLQGTTYDALNNKNFLGRHAESLSDHPLGRRTVMQHET